MKQLAKLRLLLKTVILSLGSRAGAFLRKVKLLVLTFQHQLDALPKAVGRSGLWTETAPVDKYRRSRLHAAAGGLIRIGLDSKLHLLIFKVFRKHRRIQPQISRKL